MLIAVICLLVCLWVLKTIYNRPKSGHEMPPIYPGYIPIIGHTYLFLTDTTKFWLTMQRFAEYAVQKGGVIHLIFGSQIYYLITDPEDALTASNECLQKHFAFDYAKPWLGDGLITSGGEIWRRHRKFLQPAFGMSTIFGYLEGFNSQAKKLVEATESHAGQGFYNNDVYVKKISLETFCTNQSASTLPDGKTYVDFNNHFPFAKSTFGINPIENNNFTDSYMKSVETALSISAQRFVNFWMQSDFLFWLCGLKKVQENAVNGLINMSNEILQRKKAALKNSVSDGNNTSNKYKALSDILLELSENGTFTDKEMREEMDTMVAASFETTSTQLVYVLGLVGAHPNVQNKLYEEIMEVVGPERDVIKDDISQLVYTNAVLLETLRMYPAVPLLLRYVDKDVKLKNYTMRAGSQCLLGSLINRNDPTWGPDCDKFKPERWLNNPELSGRKEFASFGLGKRACIGKHYAMLIMKIFLAHFIRRYEVFSDITKLKVKLDFVLKPVSGHEISITRRN